MNQIYLDYLTTQLDQVTRRSLKKSVPIKSAQVRK